MPLSQDPERVLESRGTQVELDVTGELLLVDPPKTSGRRSQGRGTTMVRDVESATEADRVVEKSQGSDSQARRVTLHLLRDLLGDGRGQFGLGMLGFVSATTEECQ